MQRARRRSAPDLGRPRQRQRPHRRGVHGARPRRCRDRRQRAGRRAADRAGADRRLRRAARRARRLRDEHGGARDRRPRRLRQREHRQGRARCRGPRALLLARADPLAARGRRRGSVGDGDAAAAPRRPVRLSRRIPAPLSAPGRKPARGDRAARAVARALARRAHRGARQRPAPGIGVDTAEDLERGAPSRRRRSGAGFA